MAYSDRYNKVWSFTSAWEGAWDGEKETFDVKSDAIASYGITPAFLWQQYGMAQSKVTKAFMRSINKDTAKEIWFNSRWTWFKCEQIKDEHIAMLVFDIAVRKPAFAVAILCAVTGLQGQRYALKKNVDIPKQEVFDALNKMDVGTAYLAIVQAYLKMSYAVTKAGVIYRMACLLFKRTFTTTDSNTTLLTPNTFMKSNKAVSYIAAVKELFKLGRSEAHKKGLTATITDNTPQYGKWFMGAAAVWAGGKLFKWW
jgi:lysozyme family protein